MDPDRGSLYGQRMDIRTKLTFVLVGVALASMTALAVAMSGQADEALRESRLAQFDALAEAERDALGQIFAAWRDRVALIASRTALRQSLEAHRATGAGDASGRIARILSDAVSSVEVVRSASVYDPGGRLVAAAGTDEGVASLDAPPTAGDVAFEGLVPQADGVPGARFLAPLRLDGRVVGSLRVTLDAGALRQIAEDRTGLGSSGETLIVMPDVEGRPRMVRTRAADGSAPVADADGSDLVRMALEGPEGRFWRGVADREGRAVWGAVRRVPETGWAVVVKMEAQEARAPLLAFREQLVRLGLALAAFAILFATVLALRFAKPIHELAEAARRLGAGELDVRAPVASEDEVGLLARTFNGMAEELESRVSDLREFQILFESSLDMLCIAGTDGFLKRVNPAFEETVGWSADELLERPIVSFVHPDDVERTATEIERLGRGIPTVSFENRWLCADGSYKHVLWTAHPDPESGLLYAVGRDVTRLKEERERFERALEASSTAMIMVGPDGRIVLANLAAHLLFRRERGELLGEAFRDLVPVDVHAVVEALPGGEGEDRPTEVPVRETRRVTARRGDDGELELEVELTPVRMGPERHVLASVFPLGAPGGAEEEIRSLSRRLERAEARLRADS